MTLGRDGLIGIAEQLNPFGLWIGRSQRLDRLGDLVESRHHDGRAGVAQGAKNRLVGRRIRSIDHARRKSLFLGELLKPGDHRIDRAVVARRLRVHEGDQAACSLRLERGQSRREPNRRGAGARPEETAPRKFAGRARRWIERLGQGFGHWAHPWLWRAPLRRPAPENREDQDGCYPIDPQHEGAEQTFRFGVRKIRRQVVRPIGQHFRQRASGVKQHSQPAQRHGYGGIAMQNVTRAPIFVKVASDQKVFPSELSDASSA